MHTKKQKFYVLAAGAISTILISVAQAFAQGTAIIQNPLGTSTLCGFIKSVLNVILAVGVPFCVLFIVYAGFLFVFARGNPAALQKAKLNFLYVVIGILVFLGAWVLGQVIANTINNISQGSGGNTLTNFSTCN